MLRCHGRLRTHDDSGRRYMDDCYSCARHCRTEIEPDMWMATPYFWGSCSAWILKPEICEANERWPEER